MYRFVLDKVDKGAVYFFDEGGTLYVESARDIIKNGLVEFFNDAAAKEITNSCFLENGMVSMRLTTGATWVPSQRLKYFPNVSLVIMAAVLLSCTLVNVKLPFLDYKVSACCLLLPFIFIFSDAINELYGYRMTRNVIWSMAAGLLILGALTHFTLEVLAVKSESIYASKSEFHLIVGYLYAYMYLCAVVLLTTDTFNAWLFRYIKSMTRGRSLWLRSLLSNSTAQFAYCAVFALGYHTIPIFARDVDLSGTKPVDFLYDYAATMLGVTLLLPLLYGVVFIIRRLDDRNVDSY